MTVLAVLTVLAALESTLPSFCFSYKIQCQEAAVTVLAVSAVSAVSAVPVVTATPVKLDPPFRHPEIWVTIHPPNSRGESSKITCFTAFFEGHLLNLRGEIFTPQNLGDMGFQGS